MLILTAAVLAAWCLVHICVGRLHLSRSVLSAAGGAAAAYVFVYALPKLADKQVVLQETSESGVLDYLGHHAYLVALMGFAVFYGLRRLGAYAAAGESGRGHSGAQHFALNAYAGGHASYSLLVGYLFGERPNPDLLMMALVGVAMFIHFLSMDHALRHDHEQRYDRIYRWVLVAAILAGWLVAGVTHFSDRSVALWFSFLAGAIIINAIDEELPKRETGRFWPFLAGTAAFTVLVLAVERLADLSH